MSKAGGAPQRVLAVWCPDWSPAVPEDGPEARAFEQVAGVIAEFCPRVEVVRPGVCAIGARGPSRYFGGEEALARKITDAVTALGVGCRAGVADGLFAALLAARAPRGRAAPARARAAGRAAAAAGPPAVIVSPGRTPAFLAPHPVSVLDSAELATCCRGWESGR